MQLTMNNASVFASSVNRIGSWIGNAVQKITAAFTVKKETPAIGKEVTEAIKFIEWRTWYDQQRIARYVYTASFQKSNPELYNALGMTLPIKCITSETIAENRLFDWSLKTYRTKEILIETGDWKNRMKVNVQLTLTDDSFERRLLKYFGNLKLEVKELLNGGKTKTQRFVKRNNRVMELYLDRIPEMLFQSDSLNGYERQILSALVAPAAIVHIPQIAPALLMPGAIETIDKPEEVVVEVVAETLPEPVVVINTTPLTDEELAQLRRAIVGKKSINELLLSDLKLYAKAHKIHKPGKVTRIKAIRQIVVTAQNDSAKIVEI